VHLFTVLLVSVASICHLYLGCCWHSSGASGTVCAWKHQHGHAVHLPEAAAEAEDHSTDPSPAEPHPHHCSQHGRCWWNQGSRQQDSLPEAIPGKRLWDELLIVPKAAASILNPEAYLPCCGSEALAQLGVFLC